MGQAAGHCLNQEETVTGSGSGGNCDRRKLVIRIIWTADMISGKSNVYEWGAGDRTRAMVSVTAVARKAAWSLRARLPVSGEGTDEQHIWKIMGWKQ